MSKLKAPRVLSFGIISLLCVSSTFAAPPTLVWNIGTPDGLSNEFEHENQGDEFFYLHEGDYSTTPGWDTLSNSYSLYGSPFATAEPIAENPPSDPPIPPVDPIIGFERALVGGGSEDTINIFFQLNASHVPAGAKYRFDAVFSGGNSSHNVTLGFNGQEFTSPISVGQSPIKGYQQIFTAAEVNAMIGSNVLTLRTENTTAGQYTTLDYLRLTLIDPNVIFSLGANDNSQADFELEGDARNDAKFYVHAGNYSTVNGSTGAGADVLLPEFVQDGSATDGLPRALVPSRPKLDLFFQLTPEEAAAEKLRFEADLFSLGGGSSHDLVFSINGVTLGTFLNVTAAQLASFEFFPADVNALAGSNVISIERIGGSTTNSYIQFDYLQLSTVPEPSSAVLLALGAFGLGAFRRRRAA